VHVFPGLYLIDNISKGIVNTSVKLGFLDLECVPDPKELDNDDPHKGYADAKDQNV